MLSLTSENINQRDTSNYINNREYLINKSKRYIKKYS